MSDRALSPDDTVILIDEERWPLSTELRAVREAIEKLRPKPEPMPLRPVKPYEPSMLMQKRRRR